MKRKAITLMLLALLMLSGCSLAREDESVMNDRFVGCCVVLERSGEPATPEVYELSEGENHIILTEERVDDGEGVSIGFQCGRWISDQKMNVHESDHISAEGRRVRQSRTQRYSMEASVLLEIDEAQASNVNWRLDAVYQRADGSFYARQESGSMGGQIDNTTLRKSAEYEIVDEQGRTVARTVEVGVTLSLRRATQRAVIYEMSADNAVIARHELNFDALAKNDWTLQVSSQAEWLLFEKEDGAGVVRTVLEFEGNRAAGSILRADRQIKLIEGCTALVTQRLNIERPEA